LSNTRWTEKIGRNGTIDLLQEFAELEWHDGVASTYRSPIPWAMSNRREEAVVPWRLYRGCGARPGRAASEEFG